jgi:hypothetical protein
MPAGVRSQKDFDAIAGQWINRPTQARTATLSAEPAPLPRVHYDESIAAKRLSHSSWIDRHKLSIRLEQSNGREGGKLVSLLHQVTLFSPWP